MRKNLWGLIPIGIALLVWELFIRLNPHALWPGPGRVFLTFIGLLKSGELGIALFKSSIRVFLGLFLGTSFGFLLGLLMGTRKSVELWLSPLLSILYPIPALGWLPLLILWLGIGEKLPIALIFLCSFFPVLYNTLRGIKEVPQELIWASRVLGASKLRTLLQVVLPLALPNILTGLRLEAGMAWRTVLASEMIAIPSGIGAMMWKAESLMRVDVIIVALGVLGLACFLSERVFIWLENRCLKWKSSWKM
jgi:NitT/TauT family transport system permease protein